MERYDAVVIGAGPAGAVCAYRLASAGASVLLLDKARFPRDKPCGGGVTVRAARELPFSIDPVVEDVVDRFELRLGYGKSFERGGDGTLCLMTQRRRLDHFLAERAVEKGAQFRHGVRVGFEDDLHRTTPAPAPDYTGAPVTLSVDDDPVQTDIVIGADGVNGATAKAFGLARRLGHGVALEGNLANEGLDGRSYRGRLVLELGVVPGGYGWVFPKGDHVNFGVGGWEDEGPKLREHLRRLCEAHGVRAGDLTDLRGYRLPFRRPLSAVAGDRVLLVGDAAGLVDPLSGDGMFEAFVSARLAAEAVLAQDLAAYPARLERALGPLHRASWTAKHALERFPRATFALARLPFVWPVVARIVRGELSDPAEARGLASVPFKALDRLGRAPA